MSLRVHIPGLLRCLLFGLAVLCCAAPDAAAQIAAHGISAHGRAGGLAVDIPINKSDVLHSERPFTEVAVGNPKIADVQVLGDRSLYVFGRQFGATSVTLTDGQGHVIAVIDINVVQDVSRLKQMLHALLPAEKISVRAAEDGIVLSGKVSSASAAANAMTIAKRYAPDAVSNLMTVAGNQQVMLGVRFVEMRRDAAKRLGINADAAFGGGAVKILGQVTSTIASPLAALGLDIATGSVKFDAFLDLLEKKGVARTLAEPTLVALSGDTADFLAGGEFPIPVGADNGQIKIEFKNYGVGYSPSRQPCSTAT